MSSVVAVVGGCLVLAFFLTSEEGKTIRKAIWGEDKPQPSTSNPIGDLIGNLGKLWHG